MTAASRSQRASRFALVGGVIALTYLCTSTSATASASAAAAACQWSPFTPPGASANASICLRSDDLLSNAIRRTGHWPECADLPALHRLAGGGELFVDIGANIGACTLHMLLASSAHVLAFEPGADNRLYAEASLSALRARLPRLKGRARLQPLALSDADGEASLHQAIGNAGHATIGAAPPEFAPLGHRPAEAVAMRTLDEVLWPRTAPRAAPRVALLKLDVEGFECKVLGGARRLLAAGAIGVLKVEVFDSMLRLQGCSAVMLQRRLADAGYRLYVAPPDSRGSAAADAAAAVAADRGVAAALEVLGVELSPDAVAPGATEPYNVYCISAALAGAPRAAGVAPGPLQELPRRGTRLVPFSGGRGRGREKRRRGRHLRDASR